MALHYIGYHEARERVTQMSEPELLNYIDALFGRDNLKYGDTIEALRAEALRQCEREWTDTASPEYETVEFWKSVIRAKKAGSTA